MKWTQSICLTDDQYNPEVFSPSLIIPYAYIILLNRIL